MKKTVKKILATVLTAVMIMTAIPLAAIADIDFGNFFSVKATDDTLAASGQCGDNVYWSFDSSIGKLTISGTGAMKNYGLFVNPSPFDNNSSIKNVVIESGVTSIGKFAFQYCRNLTGITIPSGVTGIGEGAFYECSGLTGISIPGSVTVIGEHAFYACSGLTGITIPNSVTSLGGSTFSCCTGLKYAVISDKITSIGEDTFGDCTGLTEITIPNSVTDIGDGAFFHCIGLTDITLSNSLKSIGEEAFFDCSGLTDFIIPNSVTSIGATAFYKCTGLTDIVIPDSVKSISDTAFWYCTNLTSVSVGSGLTDLGEQVFKCCESLAGITVSGKNSKYDSRNNCNAIIETATNTLLVGCKNTVIPNNVTGIGDYAFFDCPGLTGITIPDSVKSIGDHAFSYCDNLASLTIPAGVTAIGKYQFEQCPALKSLTVSEGNPKYDSRYNCNAIIETATNTLIAGGKYSVIPVDVTGIGDTAFYLAGITDITIPKSVKSIGKWAFYACLIRDVYYSGTEEQWNNLIGSFNDPLSYGEIHYNTVLPVPTGTISSTNNVAASQAVTLSLSDSVGVAGYYWGTNSDYTKNTYTSTGSSAVTKTITEPGVYYFTVKNRIGNVSSTSSIIFYKTTLNANGGSVSPTSVLTKSGNSFTFPTPTRSGYTYAGWATSSGAASGVTTLKPTSNSTYSAVWTYNDTTKPTGSISSTNNVAASQTVTLSLSDNVGVAGYYWGTSSTYSNNTYTATSSSSAAKSVNSAGTYYLTVKDTSGNISSTSSITFYKTTLDANGGSVSPTSVLTKSGNSFTFPTPTRSGYTYAGWATSSGAASGVTTLKPTSNSTYSAVWTYNDTTKPTGSISSTNNVAASQTVTLSLSDNVGVAGYYWGTSSTYTSNTYTATTASSVTKSINSAGTYYLTVKDTSGNVSSNYSITFYKTTLNANGGSVSPTSVLTKSGNSFTFPTPTKSGYTYAGWATSSGAASGVTTLTPTSSTTYFAVWQGSPEISVTVQDKNGSNIGAGATVELYDQNGKLVARKQTGSNSICNFSKEEYSKAKSVSAYKDKEYKGGSNRAAAKSKYNNVIYSLRSTSDYITSSGKWCRESFNGENIRLKLSNPKIILNLSLSYYYDSKAGDYYSDIIKALGYVNQYIQNATDGYMELGSVAVFSTTDANAFYKKDSVAAKCDVQVRQYSSDSWGADVWPNSHINGASNDMWYGDQYLRVQMQKNAAGADISTNPQTWAKILTHELGHYLFGFYDEYLNKNDEQWDDIGRPSGAPSNYGLMEYQYTDLEMSVPKDYTDVSSSSERYITAQYYYRGMSCWDYFDKIFFSPNGMHVSIPQSDRRYEEITNTVTVYDCRGSFKAPALFAAAQESKDTSLFVMASFKDSYVFLETDEIITKCTVSTFGNEDKKTITPEKVAGGYRIPASEFDENNRFLVVESENNINTFDIYDAYLSTDKAFSNRNNSILLQSGISQNCGVIIYNSSNESGQFDSFGRIAALNVEKGNSFTLVGRTEFNGTIDYSSLSWHRYDNGKWVEVESSSSIGEYSSYETKCTVTESGIYALIAAEKAANAPSLPSDKSYFTTESFNSKDGGIKINISYSNDTVIGYKIQCQSKDKSETIMAFSSDTELTVKADSPNQEYDVTVWAVFDNGTEVSLGKAQTVLSGEYCQEGSQIPYWWVVKYNLQESENEIVDNKDNDNDGFTNLQEYRGGTDPTLAEETPAASGRITFVTVNDIEVKYKNSNVIKADVKHDGDVKYTVKYESSNPSVATVDDYGNITTLHKGDTTITCTVTDEYGNVVKDTCNVNVYFSFGQWLIWILLLGFLWY